MEKIFCLSTVIFNTNGGNHIQEQKLLTGEKIIKPADPVKEGYDFGGWYEDNNTFNIEWNFNIPANKDITLFARWFELAAVTRIELVQPPQLVYAHGDSLNLQALSVILYYDDGTSVTVEFNNFSSRKITVNYAHGDLLRRYEHDGIEVEVSAGGFTASAGVLTVNRKLIAVSRITHSKKFDGTTEAFIGCDFVELSGVIDEDKNYVFVSDIAAEYTSAETGTKTVDITDITLSGDRADNYIINMPVLSFEVNGGIKEDGEHLFTFNVDDIYDSGFVVPSGLVLYRSTGAAREITVTGENINSVEWIYGAEAITGSAVTNNGRTITLAVSANINNPAYNAPYNIAGKHLLTVIITKNNVPYSGRIEFEVVN